MGTVQQRAKEGLGRLPFPPSSGEPEQHSLPEAFKHIYYHLYTNSRASRAELIIEDLSLLLLSKLSSEIKGGASTLSSFLGGKGTADRILLPMLREAFPGLVGPRQSFALGDDSLRTALAELGQIELAHAPAHALGEAFQALIGPRLRGEKGQFFTPKSLVRAMVEIVDPKPGEAVADPACGTGGFLAETQIYQLRAYPDERLSGNLVGVDKDTGLARLASALLEIVSHGRGRVYGFNSLSALAWRDHVGAHISEAYEVVLTNPPFGAKIGVKDETILADFDLGHVWVQEWGRGKWVQTRALSNSQDPQILFLELCVRALKPGGRLGIVLPEGVFGNRQTSYVWDWLEGQGHITALLDCPRTMFQPGTDTKTNVLFFKKAGDREGRKAVATLVAVAIDCGHDRRGRSYRDDFPVIASAFHDANMRGRHWREANLAEQRYLVPRYHYNRDEGIGSEIEITRGAEFATLGELVKAKIIRVRKGHEVGSAAYGTGTIPFVRTSDLSNFEISTDPTKAVSEAVYEGFAAQQKLKTGDVLMVVDGRYRIGTTAILTEQNVQCVVQSHLRIISTLRPDRVDPYELLYALNLPSIKLRMRSLVFIQSTLGTLGNRLLELRLPLLHGDGPWRGRVARFRETLEQRSRLLAELQAMAWPDYEL